MLSALLSEELLTAKSEMLADLRDKAVFARSMAFLYRTMLASEDLCLEAMQACRMGVGSDYILRLRDYLTTHLDEERGHAAWLKDDLEAAGIMVGEGIDWLAAAVAGSQYYAINHAHPCALLGYMLFLEGSSMPEGDLRALEVEHGVEALRTLRYHALHDPQHVEDLRGIIDATPADLQNYVVGSAMVTAAYWKTAVQRSTLGIGQMDYLTKVEHGSEHS